MVHVAGGTVLEGEGDSAVVVESGHGRGGGFVAATANDTTNLWLVSGAAGEPRRVHHGGLDRRANAPLFEAVGVDFGLVPAEVIAHEVLARLANPVLMRFLPQVPTRGTSGRPRWSTGWCGGADAAPRRGGSGSATTRPRR